MNYYAHTKQMKKPFSIKLAGNNFCIRLLAYSKTFII